MGRCGGVSAFAPTDGEYWLSRSLRLFLDWLPPDPCGFVIVLLRVFEEPSVVIHLLFLLQGVDLRKPSQVPVLKLVSKLLSLCPQGLLLFRSEFGFLPSENSLVALLPSTSDDLLFLLRSEIHDGQGILDEVEFDEFIQRGVSCEAWCVVDLEKTGFCLAVQKNVEP